MKKTILSTPAKLTALLTHSLWLLVALVALGQLQRIELTPDSAVYVHDVFIVLWLMMVAAFFREEIWGVLKSVQLSPWQKLALGGLGWSLAVTVVVSIAEQTVTPLLFVARLAAYLGFAASLKLLKPQLTLQLQHLVVAALIAVLGLVQFIVLPDTRFLFILGWDDHLYRLISTLFDPAFTGMVLLLGLLFSFALSPQIPRRWIWLLRVLLTGALVLTFSRATYLAGLVAAGTLLVQQQQKIAWKPLIGLCVGMVLLITILQSSVGGEGTKIWRLSTISARIENVQSALSSLTMPTLLLGNGWFTTTPEQTQTLPNHAKVPDNLLVFMLTSMGLPAMITLVVGLGGWLKKTLLQKPVLQAVLLAVLIHTQFSNTLLQPFVWLYLWWGIFSMRKVTAAT